MRGVFLDRGSVSRGDIDFSALERTLEQWDWHEETTPAQVGERIREADVVITNKVTVEAAAMAEAGRLRLICVAATGTNNVDLEAARERGVAVCNVRGYATASVVEHTFALILALARNLAPYTQAVRAGRWRESAHFCMLDFPVVELSGRLLGIVGYGELGRAVGAGARAFGMQVAVAERPGAPENRPGRVPLDELLTQVDVLSLHCPLTPQTQGLIGAEALSRMKPSAFLINTARGGIVQEQALADALRSGQIAGAGVDVLSEEPPRGANPLLAPDIPNLIVTPHVAWATRAARQRLVDELVANLKAYRAGQARNLVT